MPTRPTRTRKKEKKQGGPSSTYTAVLGDVGDELSRKRSRRGGGGFPHASVPQTFFWCMHSPRGGPPLSCVRVRPRRGSSPERGKGGSRIGPRRRRRDARCPRRPWGRSGVHGGCRYPRRCIIPRASTTTGRRKATRGAHPIALSPFFFLDMGWLSAPPVFAWNLERRGGPRVSGPGLADHEELSSHMPRKGVSSPPCKPRPPPEAGQAPKRGRQTTRRTPALASLSSSSPAGRPKGTTAVSEARVRRPYSAHASPRARPPVAGRMRRPVLPTLSIPSSAGRQKKAGSPFGKKVRHGSCARQLTCCVLLSAALKSHLSHPHVHRPTTFSSARCHPLPCGYSDPSLARSVCPGTARHPAWRTDIGAYSWMVRLQARAHQATSRPAWAMHAASSYDAAAYQVVPQLFV